MEINAEGAFAKHDLKSDGFVHHVFDFSFSEVRFYQCLRQR